MKVFMIGGTGLIGSEVAKQLILNKHEVTTLALKPLPKEAKFPKEMKIVFGNYLTISENELLNLMADADALIFAAGIDERIESKPPIYDVFKKYNIDGLKRTLKIAKSTTIKDVVICGSYFTYFADKWPHLKLSKHHPYIKSRLDQKEMALSFADSSFNVSVIELPYIFGIQEGRKPVWVFLVEIIKKMKRRTYFPNGGTTMITVRQAAFAIVGAMLKNKGGNSYPIGYYNMEWKEFLTIVHEAMGEPNKKIVTVPNFIFKIAAVFMDLKRKFKGVEGGLKMRKYAKLQTTNLFIDKEEASIFLGVEEDNIKEAIFDSISLSMKIIENDDTDIVEMRVDENVK